MNVKKGGKSFVKPDESSSRLNLNSSASVQEMNPTERYNVNTNKVGQEDDPSERNEIHYFDPDRLSYNRSPLHQGRQNDKKTLGQRSPINQKQSVIQAVKNDLNDIANVNRNPIQTLSINIPLKREDGYEHSPKAIYLGTQNPFSINTKTRDKRNSPSYQDRKTEERKSHQNNNFEKPNLEKKMSPNIGEVHYEKENTTEVRKKVKRDKIDKLKNMQNLVYYNNNDDLDKEEGDIEDPQERENLFKLYNQDLGKLGIDPNKNNHFIVKRKHTGFNQTKPEGKLVNQNIQIYNPFMTVEEFKERNTSVGKINRLSNIILSRSLSPKARSLNNTENRDEDDFKPIRENTENLLFRSNKNKKFIRITLAMLKSKGPNCEDRVITRDMRTDKGGVVDLAHKNYKIKNYKIKKVDRTTRSKSPVKQRNQKDKLLAGKLIQKWWREILSNYSKALDKITRLQSAWRGYWVRTYLYEIVYFSILSQAFVDKFKPPIVHNARREAFDLLINNFGEKYLIGLSIQKIVKFQRKVKEFLNRIRDKRMKFNLRLEKLYFRKLRDAFEAIKDESKNFHKKALKSLKFLEKVKLMMRKKIFHELMHEIFMLPVYQLRKNLKSKLMKKYFDIFHLFHLRRKYNFWKKIALQNKLSNKQIEMMVRQLQKSITMPHYNELKNGLKDIFLRKFRNKLVRKLMKRAGGAYRELILREYLKRWLKIHRELNVLEFKGKIFDSFMFRTKSGMIKKYLRKYMRLWFINAFKKYGTDQVRKFLEDIKKPIQKNVWTTVVPKIQDCVHGLKGKIVDRLLFGKGKFKLLTLRVFFGRWRKVVINDMTLSLVTKTLLTMRKNKKALNYIKVLLGKFQDWRRKAAMLRYLNKEEFEDENKRKQRAATNLFNTLELAAKKIGLWHLYPFLMRFLIDSIRSKAIKAMSKMNPKFNKIIKRMNLRKWKDINLMLLKKDFRNKFFNKLIGNTSGKFKLNILRIYFQFWLRNKERNPLVKINNGLALLIKHCQRKVQDDIYNALKKKMDKEEDENRNKKKRAAAKSSLNLRGRVLRGFYKSALEIWRLKVLAMQNRDRRHLIWSKLFNHKLIRIYKKSLAYGFYYWRSNKHELKWDELDQLRKRIAEAYEQLRNKNNKLHFQFFINNMKNYKSNRYLRVFKKKLESYAELSKENTLKKYLSLWKLKCRKWDIYMMKLKLMKFALTNKDITANKLIMLRGLRTWVKSADLKRMEAGHYSNLIINSGVDHLKKVLLGRKNNFFRRLLKLIKLDARGIIMLKLNQRLNKPRYTMSRAFDIWRRIVTKMKLIDQEDKYARQMLFGSCKKLTSRLRRDALKGALYKWLSKLRKPEDYYDKICRVNLN